MNRRNPRDSSLPLERLFARRRALRRGAAAVLALGAGAWAIDVWRTAGDALGNGELPVLDAPGPTELLVLDAAVRRPVALLGVLAAESKAAECHVELRALTQGATVRCRVPIEADATRPHRAYVYLPDGRMINQWLLETGLADIDQAHHPLSDWFGRLARRSTWRPVKRG
jgi:hypothetical protein